MLKRRPALPQPAPGSPERRRFLVTCALMLGLAFAHASVQADSDGERRIRTAARLVRALLSADLGVADKRTDDGWLEVLVLMKPGQPELELGTLISPASAANGPTKVRGLPLRVRTVTQVPGADSTRPIMVFLASPLGDREFQQLLAWCIGEQVILYSPFDGDVERGATAGLSVQAKVQPFLNRTTLESSRIELQAFFVQHSRTVP